MALLLGCMALPSVVKLAHALHGHEETKCHRESRLHFHNAEFDCAFQKFNKTTVFIHDQVALELNPPVLILLQPRATYLDLYNHLPLHFSLRAPPLRS